MGSSNEVQLLPGEDEGAVEGAAAGTLAAAGVDDAELSLPDFESLAGFESLGFESPGFESLDLESPDLESPDFESPPELPLSPDDFGFALPYPSAYHPPPLKLIAGAEITRSSFSPQCGQAVISGSENF